MQLSGILSLVGKYKFSIVLFVYLLLIAFYPVDFSFNLTVFISVVSLVFLVNILASRRYLLPLNIIFIFLIFASAFFSFLYKSYIYVEALLAIVNTNTEEAFGMFKQFVVPGFVILIGTILLVLLSQKEMRGSPKISLKLSIGIVLLFSFLYLPWQMNRMLTKIEFARVTASSEVNAMYVNSFAPVFYGNIVSGYATVKELRKKTELLKKIKNRVLLEGITLDTKATDCNKIVLVIGESSSSMHYSLYGYKIATTPFLDKLRDSNSSVFSFYNTISPAPSTISSLDRVLSFATIEDVSRLYSNKVIVGMANDAKYNTYWISNQNMVGTANSLFDFFKSETKNSFYLKVGSEKKSDLGLIPEFERIFNKDEKQFIVLHMEGSHLHYADKIDDVDHEAINYEDKGSVDYDRSIHHTDRFLKAVYDVMKRDSSSVMIYFSDHGEIVGLGHGYMKNFREQYEIPLVTYNFSKNNMDSIISEYSDRKNNRFNAVNISYVLSELLGYKISDTLKNAAVEDAKYVFLPDRSVVEYNSIKNK